MRQRFRDAAAIDDLDGRKRAAKWALGSESRARLDALLYLAQSELPIADAGDGWDAQPHLLNVVNGTSRFADWRDEVRRAARTGSHCARGSSMTRTPDRTVDHALRTILVDDEIIDFFQCDWLLGDGRHAT